MKTIVQCTTARAAGLTGQVTTLTIDWTGVTEAGYQALATSALTIKLQAGWRKNGIPATASVLAIEHLLGTRAKGPTLEQQVEAAKTDPELRARLIAMLGGVAPAESVEPEEAPVTQGDEIETDE